MPTSKSGTIAASATVRIVPGTEVIAKGAFKILVSGGLLAGGLRRSRIVLRSNAGARASWTGLELGNALATVLEYADVLDASIGVRVLASTTVNRLVRCRIANCDTGISVEAAEKLNLVACAVEDNRIGLAIAGAITNVNNSVETVGVFDTKFRKNQIGLQVSGTSTLTVNAGRNRVYDNALAGASVVATLNAEDVWWGSDTGPQHASVSGGLGDKVTGAGTVDVTPWTELLLYVPRSEELRAFCNGILREVGTAAVESLETTIDDSDLETMLRRAQAKYDSFHTDDSLPKPLLARGTETNEEIDAVRWRISAGYYQLRYRPIRAVTSVQRRLGSAWETLDNDEWTGWWSSGEMLRLGVVRIHAIAASPVSTYRATYTHGHDTMPEDVRDAVVKIAALEVFHAVLLPGAADAYASRAQPLRDEVADVERRARPRKVGWVT